MHRGYFGRQIASFYKVKNPKRIEAEKRGKFVRYMDREVDLGTKDRLPIGALYWAHKKGIEYSSTIPKITKPENKKSNINLFPNQQEVFDEVKDYRSFLVEFKMGSGKTVIISRLCEYWGGKILVLAHNKLNVGYISETIKTFTGQDCGVYYSAKKELKDITVTTFNTAVLHSKIFENYGFDAVIIDEADAFFSDKRRDWLTDFPAMRKCGFTGTIGSIYDKYEPSHLPPALIRYYGKHVLGKSDKKKNVLREIYFRRSGLPKYTENIHGIELPIPVKDWHQYREYLDGDQVRKAKMIEYIAENTEDGDRALILFDRVSDTEWFHEAIPGSYMIHGKVKNEDRDKAKKDFLSKGGIMIAQKMTSGRGIDLPECNKVFILFPIKAENELQQIVGRALRYMPNKDSYIYDWVDTGLYSQFTARKHAYWKAFNLTPKEI